MDHMGFHEMIPPEVTGDSKELEETRCGRWSLAKILRHFGEPKKKAAIDSASGYRAPKTNICV